MTQFDLAIHGGSIVTASDEFRGDIGIRDGRIVALAERIEGAARERFSNFGIDRIERPQAGAKRPPFLVVIEDRLRQPVPPIGAIEPETRREVGKLGVDPGLIHFEEYRALVGEVRIEGPRRIARGLGNPVGVGAVIADGIEKFGCGLDQQTAALLGVTRLSGFAHQSGSRFVFQQMPPDRLSIPSYF